MTENFELCKLVARICSDSGFGQFVQVWNDIEKKYYYIVGQFRPKNPSDRRYESYMDGVDVTYIFDNKSSFFLGSNVNNQKVFTYISQKLEEDRINVSFDFRFVSFN